MLYQACSFHEPLLPVIGQTCSGTVLSSHRRTVNLQLNGDILLSLVDPSLGNGPGAVLVPGLWPLGWAPGERVTLGGRTLRGHGCAVRLEGARPWSPPAPPGRVASAGQGGEAGVPDQVGAALARMGNPAGLLPAALAALGFPELQRGPETPVAGALLTMGLRGVRSLLAGDWSAAVAQLVGLGPGSTPAGDDLLCGFTCTLARGGSTEATAMGEAVRNAPPSATTVLSRHLLWWSTQGVAGEHGITLVDEWLAGRMAEAVRTLPAALGHGATSGSDWASGAMLAMYDLGREVSRNEAV